MDTQLLAKVKAAIERNEAAYDQGRWVDPCGTTMCIAGHIVAQADDAQIVRDMGEGTDFQDWRAVYKGDVVSIPYAASQLADLFTHEADVLFQGAPLGEWTSVQDAIATLDWAINMQEVDWESWRKRAIGYANDLEPLPGDAAWKVTWSSDKEVGYYSVPMTEEIAECIMLCKERYSQWHDGDHLWVRFGAGEDLAGLAPEEEVAARHDLIAAR